jgi:hypothetical protein
MLPTEQDKLEEAEGYIWFYQSQLNGKDAEIGELKGLITEALGYLQDVEGIPAGLREPLASAAAVLSRALTPATPSYYGE